MPCWCGRRTLPHIYDGLDLERLSTIAKPSAVVTAEDVERIRVRVPEFYAGDLFCPLGKTPIYLGQPVALLIFETFDVFDRARMALRDGSFLKFGEETGPVPIPNYGAFRFTRVAGPTPDAPDIYSPILAGWISPGFLETDGRPMWKPLPVAKGGEYVEGATYGEQIRAALAKPDPAILMLDRKFDTQSVDPMFLEPECGLAWYDSGAKKLEIVLGVQSPFEAASAVAYLLSQAEPGLPAQIHRRPVRLCGRRLWRARSHALSALRNLGGYVLSRPSRYAWRTTAFSSSRPASSAMLSTFAPRSA